MLAKVGFKKLGIRQWVVLAAFVVFSVGGQLIPKMAVGEQIQWHLLPMGIVPLIMTTFFEEFLFRGFVQSRIDRQFGWVPAILVSGAMFSLYHLGYPGFRTWEDILLLFAVGGGCHPGVDRADSFIISKCRSKDKEVKNASYLYSWNHGHQVFLIYMFPRGGVPEI